MTGRARRTLLFALGLSSPIVSQKAVGVSFADEARDAGTDAQSLFERGKEAMSVGRFSEAERLFRQSVELVPKASAAFNLAVARRGMGKPKEARDTLVELLAGRYGPLPDDRRGQAEELARETEGEISTIVIGMKGAPSAEVRVDGTRVGDVTDSRALTAAVNPGEHVVALSAKLRDTVERSVVVAPGKTVRVATTLTLSRAARRANLVLVAELATDEVAIVGVASARGRLERKLDPGRYQVRVTSAHGTKISTIDLVPATSHRVVLESPRASLLTSPWLWAASAVVVAGAVTGYLLLRDQERDPVHDSVYGVTETLRY
jgi:hypothetical protein